MHHEEPSQTTIHEQAAPQRSFPFHFEFDFLFFSYERVSDVLLSIDGQGKGWGDWRLLSTLGGKSGFGDWRLKTGLWGCDFVFMCIFSQCKHYALYVA